MHVDERFGIGDREQAASGAQGTGGTGAESAGIAQHSRHVEAADYAGDDARGESISRT